MKKQSRQYKPVGTRDDDPLFGTGADPEPQQQQQRREPEPAPAPSAGPAEPMTDGERKMADTRALLEARLQNEKESWIDGTVPAAEMKARAERRKQIELMEQGAYDPRPASAFPAPSAATSAGPAGGGGQEVMRGQPDGWSDDDEQSAFVEASGPPVGDPLGRKIAARASQ